MIKQRDDHGPKSKTTLTAIASYKRSHAAPCAAILVVSLVPWPRFVRGYLDLVPTVLSRIQTPHGIFYSAGAIAYELAAVNHHLNHWPGLVEEPKTECGK